MKNGGELFAQGKKALSALGRYKYTLLVIAAGVVFLLLPGSDEGGGARGQAELSVVGSEEDFSVEALEEKLADTLSQIDGAGQVRVMLTVQSGMRRELAQNSSSEQDGTDIRRENETVVVSTGSGTQEAVLVQQIYPQFQGALVVAPGGGDPAVRLKLTEAVAALTGLGADKISICKGK